MNLARIAICAAALMALSAPSVQAAPARLARHRRSAAGTGFRLSRHRRHSPRQPCGHRRLPGAVVRGGMAGLDRLRAGALLSRHSGRVAARLLPGAGLGISGLRALLRSRPLHQLLAAPVLVRGSPLCELIPGDAAAVAGRINRKLRSSLPGHGLEIFPIHDNWGRGPPFPATIVRQNRRLPVQSLPSGRRSSAASCALRRNWGNRHRMCTTIRPSSRCHNGRRCSSFDTKPSCGSLRYESS